MHVWIVSFTVVLSLSCGPVVAERWYTLYNQAIYDLEAGRYEAAIAKLEAAVSQNPKSGTSMRVEASRTVRYFPYFLLGKAYFHLGKYDEATKFLAQESRSNPPEKLSQAIVSYQQGISSIKEEKRRAEFNRALAASEAARKEGAFAKAVEPVEKARQTDRAEFQKRGLAKVLASVGESERQRVAEAERQRKEAAFQDLVRQASVKEKQGALGETTELLQKADELIPSRGEVKALRDRMKEREEQFTSAMLAASAAEREGRIAEAIGNLKQAEQAHPERYKAEKLATLADSLSRQAEIEGRLNAGAADLERGRFKQAVETYDVVLRADPENMTAKKLRSRAQFLQLLARGDELAGARSFPDALEAFELARTQNGGEGQEVYERMQRYLPELRAGRSPIRNDWMEVMRNSDPQRFAKERLGVAARRRPDSPIERPAVNDEASVRRSVLAALAEEPHEAVQLLKKVRAGRKGGNAELESWTGVAYARLSFLTTDPKLKEECRVQATQHFRRALDLDPRHRLDSRLVP
ncbi:MAG: hypothetical protein EHM18_01835, partial [Acidobacteria bacterium]